MRESDSLALTQPRSHVGKIHGEAGSWQMGRLAPVAQRESATSAFKFFLIHIASSPIII